MAMLICDDCGNEWDYPTDGGRYCPKCDGHGSWADGEDDSTERFDDEAEFIHDAERLAAEQYECPECGATWDKSEGTICPECGINILGYDHDEHWDD